MAWFLNIISILYQLLFCSHPNSELFFTSITFRKRADCQNCLNSQWIKVRQSFPYNNWWYYFALFVPPFAKFSTFITRGKFSCAWRWFQTGCWALLEFTYYAPPFPCEFSRVYCCHHCHLIFISSGNSHKCTQLFSPLANSFPVLPCFKVFAYLSWASCFLPFVNPICLIFIHRTYLRTFLTVAINRFFVAFYRWLVPGPLVQLDKLNSTYHG